MKLDTGREGDPGGRRPFLLKWPPRALAAAAGAGLIASSALAASLAPADTAFTSTGRISVASGKLAANCDARFAGATDRLGRGQITAAAFSGGMLGACGNIRAVGLPWTLRAVGPGRAAIALVLIHSPLAGDCGARDVPVSIGEGGAIGFGHVALPPRCAINGGALVARPAVRILP